MNRRAFLAGLLATTFARPLPRPDGTTYIVFEEIPLEKIGNSLLAFEEACAGIIDLAFASSLERVRGASHKPRGLARRSSG